MTRTRQRHLTLLLPLLFSNAVAQDDEHLLNEEDEEVRRYTVEMIIFTYNEEVSVGTEVFVPDPPVDDLMSELGLSPDEQSAQPGEHEQVERDLAEVEITNRRRYELVMLPQEDFTMDEIYGHLRRLDVYEPVLHFGWTQPTLPEEESETRPLTSFVTPPAALGLDGDLQLYLGRYLHLVVNLQLDAPAADIGTTRSTYGRYGYGIDEQDGYNEFETAAEQPVHYRIQENRIFRSGEVRYFDHPKFGVLAKITRFEEPEPQDVNEEFLGDTELLGLEGD